MKYFLAGLGFLAMVGTAAAQADLARAVTERREGLRQVGQHMEAMAAIARASGDPRPAVERIAFLQTWFTGFPNRFPEGTAQGAAGIETRALPAIWQNRADFEALDRALQANLATLRSTAEAGNAQAFAAALQTTGASCGNCHRPYRAR
jgi:cytochrome c556